jgi:hypothetical protein
MKKFRGALYVTVDAGSWREAESRAAEAIRVLGWQPPKRQRVLSTGAYQVLPLTSDAAGTKVGAEGIEENRGLVVDMDRAGLLVRTSDHPDYIVRVMHQ